MQVQLFLNTPEHQEIQLKQGNLQYWPSFFSEEEQDKVYLWLQKTLAWQQDYILISQKSIALPRLQVWYGDPEIDYTYSGIHLKTKPWPKALLRLKSKLEKHLQLKFNSVLANYYRNGNDSVAWHADDEPELGSDPQIACLSFGATRSFEIRSKIEKIKIPLQGGSLLLMGKGTQQMYQHHVPKEVHIQEGRISLTFRLCQSP